MICIEKICFEKICVYILISLVILYALYKIFSVIHNVRKAKPIKEGFQSDLKSKFKILSDGTPCNEELYRDSLDRNEYRRYISNVVTEYKTNYITLGMPFYYNTLDKFVDNVEDNIHLITQYMDYESILEQLKINAYIYYDNGYYGKKDGEEKGSRARHPDVE